jgi:hypothetical protein
MVPSRLLQWEKKYINIQEMENTMKSSGQTLPTNDLNHTINDCKDSWNFSSR